jgi:hypothetical protein
MERRREDSWEKRSGLRGYREVKWAWERCRAGEWVGKRQKKREREKCRKGKEKRMGKRASKFCKWKKK